MALFQASTLSFGNAKARVAESSGSSGDTDMTTRAGYAVQQALQHWNNRHHWSWLLTRTQVAVVAPFTVANCSGTVDTTTLNSTNIFGSTGANVIAGDLVVGPTGGGIRPDTIVTTTPSASSTAVTLSVALSATISATTATFVRRDYALPSDFKWIYSVRLGSNPRTLIPLPTRLYDRQLADQAGTAVPVMYSLFPVGADGKIRLMRSPSAADTLTIKYYRRITTSYTDSDALDLPQDQEFAVIAMAKAFYLNDKVSADGGRDRQQFWWSLANEEMTRAIAADATVPDEDTSLVPSGMGINLGWNPNSTVEAFSEPY